MGGSELMRREREAQVLVSQRVARGVGEVAVVVCTRAVEGFCSRCGSSVCGPGVEFIAPGAVPGTGECALDGFLQAISGVETAGR